MSFMIRRNRPRAWAGYHDSFQRPAENPIKPPWVHVGDGEHIFINDLEELVIPSNFVTSNAGGASYEFEPFTKNWGIEFEFFWPVEGLAAQAIQIYLCESWANVGAKYEYMPVVRLFHEVAQHSIRISQYPNPWTSGSDLGIWNVPFMSGSTQTVRVWFENDEWIRVWLNGNYIGSAMLDNTYKAGPGRRCIRISNTSLTGFYIRWYKAFDRPATVPPKTVWTEVFSDDFNRADGAVGNGWTQFGTDAGIVSNRYAHTGTSNSSVGLLRNMGDPHGRARIEAQIRNPSGTDCSLMLFGNAAADQALVANVRNNIVYLGRMTSSVNGTPSFFDFMNRGVTVADGDVIAFSVYSEACWFEVNGVVRAYAGNVHNVVPDSNPWAGLRVRRGDDVNSGTFDYVKIFTGVGI